MKKLSVIIPVYNVEKYLKRCIDSVLNQTYNNLEIIVVNDGSTDLSLDICKEYEEKKKIKLYSQKNKGQSASRNLGIEAATGDYIAFLDSDDYIEPKMYEILVDLLERHNEYEIAACAAVNEFEDGSQLGGQQFTNEIKFINCFQLLGDLYCNKNARSEVWNKVFKKEIVKDVRFKTDQKFEEVYFDRIVFQRAKGCIFIDMPLHHYILSRDGNTNSIFNNQKLHIFDELDDVITDLEQAKQKEEAQKIRAMQLFFSMLLGLQARTHGTDNKTMMFLESKFKEYKKINKKNPAAKNLKPRVLLYSVHPALLAFMLKLIKGNINL